MHALTLKTGAIEARVAALKFDGKSGWASIFGRLIVAYIEENDLDPDLIVANPTHASRKPIRHTEEILRGAINADPLRVYPFDDPDDPVLVKTATTTPSKSGNWHEKHAAAQELYGAIDVVHPEFIEDANILVIDDIATTLLQLNVIADILLTSGASVVEGIVITRATSRR